MLASAILYHSENEENAPISFIDMYNTYWLCSDDELRDERYVGTLELVIDVTLGLTLSRNGSKSCHGL